MFEPSSLVSAIADERISTRDKVGSLLSGIIGQLRDGELSPGAEKYLRQLEAQIPRIQDVFGVEPSASFEAEPPQATAMAEEPKADPLDHDGDGKKGGSRPRAAKGEAK